MAAHSQGEDAGGPGQTFPDLRHTVASNIRSVVEARGMTLITLADAAGVSRSQVFNVVRGACSVSLDWLARVARALHVEPWELVTQPREASDRPVRE